MNRVKSYEFKDGIVVISTYTEKNEDITTLRYRLQIDEYEQDIANNEMMRFIISLLEENKELKNKLNNKSKEE